MSKESELKDLLSPLVTEEGYRCKDVTFEKSGQNWILTVFIDNTDHTISLDDCEFVSRSLSDYLDEVDPIEQSYILEVSSPGIDAPLKSKEDFDENIGNMIEVKLYRKKDGKKEFSGELIKSDENTFTILDEKNEIEFEMSEVSKVAPMVIFEDE